MKKWILALISLGVIALTACSMSGGDRPRSDLEKWMEPNGKIRVLSTTSIVGQLVAPIGGDAINHIVLVPGEADPHSYEMVKGDDEKFAHADLVVANGLMLEHSASMQYQMKERPSTLFLGNKIQAEMPAQMILVDGQVDPHIWMDIALWVHAIDPIVEALSAKDPEHASDFKMRGEHLKQSLLEGDKRVRAVTETIPPSKRYLVTSHDAFNYFVRRYFATGENSDWRDHVQALQGLAPDSQISPLEIQNIVAYVKKHQLTTIFFESNLSKDALKKVVDACQQKGQKVKLSTEPLYGDTLGGKSYLEMMEYNAHVIAKQLGGEESP